MTSAPRVGLIAAAFYLILVGVLVAGVRRANGGHFTYALDDPYIHLAVAENLAHGHYGINVHEASSPSSSVLWPFLLIPLAGTRHHDLLPLALNCVFGCVSAYLLGWIVGGWGSRHRIAGWTLVSLALLLVLMANLASLTVVGMEHVLQVMLAICCAAGLMEALDGGKVPWWGLTAAVVAPMVRYEDLGLMLAMGLVLAGMRRWRTAACVVGVAILPLAAFSFFLRRNGLPALPLSVLVKGDAARESGLASSLAGTIVRGTEQALLEPERYATLTLFLLAVALGIAARSRIQRFVLAGAAAVGGLQLLIGKFGWFFRYEMYAVIFLMLLCLDAVIRRGWFRVWQVALVAGCASCGIIATAETVAASHDVYLQQYQMHRFVTEYYRGDYAVNDLGLTSFRRRPGVYVLDLWGLASLEAARQDEKTAGWLEDVVRRHQTPLVMIYAEWFDGFPDSWTQVGQMCEVRRPVALGEPCVAFYSSSRAENEMLRSELREFAKSLPQDVLLQVE